MKSEAGRRLGLISADVPLISNLDVWHNIALIYEYHRNIPEKKAEVFVIECLKRYGLENIAHKRNAFLSEEDRFYVMLLRAAMLPDAVIVIDRPFKIMPYLKDTSFIYDALEKVDDFFALCYIFDYAQDKNRYGNDS
ncbi:MAG: hypothetical protein Q7J31_01815 [Syntrophales bacterium]|nr:hypothetical protein [Syntrophales bacterium]